MPCRSPCASGDTLLIASGSHGKFLSRLDLEVGDGRVSDFAYGLIPVLADAIAPDPDMHALVAGIRAPHEAMLKTELAHTDGLLYRRGTFAGTFDDLICDALMVQRDAEIALSPGFRWGGTLIAGEAVTWDDVYNATAITYPAVYRTAMKGETIKAILEDVADNSFNPDPYLQQGGDMVRVGGMGYTIDVDGAMGSRIANMHMLGTGAPIEPEKEYVVAGWGSVNEGTRRPADLGCRRRAPEGAASSSRRSRANRSNSCAPAADRRQACGGWNWRLRRGTVAGNTPGHRACSHKSTSTSVWRWRAW